MTIEGNIVYIDRTSRGRIEIGDDGLISSVGAETGKADLVLGKELIFPGFVDVHVHARECADHSQDYKEDFESAGLAAINGGVVAFADMPNNPVPPVDEKSYAEKSKLTGKSAVDVLLYAGIGPKTEPLRDLPVFKCSAGPRPALLAYRKDPQAGHGPALHQVSPASRAVNVPYKVFMGPSVGDLFFSSREELEHALKKYQGQNISFHCEDPEILEANKNQSSHAEKRPQQAEVTAVEFALQMIEKYNLTGKICHCSTVQGLQKIIAAKKRGIKVSVEVAPHHLYFDDSVIARKSAADDEAILSKMFQVNPPIRQSPENRLALIVALKNGDIDFLATDHAPHTLAEKEKGISGLTHLDTYGSFVTWLMKEHGFSAQEIARVCAQNPGNFISQFMPKKYGQIAEGFVGSLTILDVNKPITISKSNLKTKAAWSPFEGIEFPGRVAHTVIKGKVSKV